MRIGVGGIWHETNTFVPTPTTRADFAGYQLHTGGELVEALRGTGTELGGAIDRAAQLRVQVAGLLFGAALPSGPVRAVDFDGMLRELCERARLARPLDGVLLSLHGAMVVEGHPDPESEIVAAVRGVVGPVPIGVALDYHANVGPRLPRLADVLSGYRTYPHTDMADRGAEVLELLARMVRTGRRPRTAFVKLPLLTVPMAQEHLAQPMAGILTELAGVLDEPGVWTASALPGFAYAEGDRLGFTVLVSADGDPEPAARAIAGSVWDARRSFRAELVSPAAAAADAARSVGTTVLVDVADNVGGGSPGDGTTLLHALAAAGATGTLAVIWDPAAVDAAHAAPGDALTIDVGGHSDPLLGPPYRATGPAHRWGTVTYRRTGSYMHGQRVDMGRVVVVQDRIGTLVLTERRVVPFDDDHLLAVGTRPGEARSIVAKGAIAWKAALARYADRTLYVRTPGYCPPAVEQLTYRERPRPLYPLEVDPAWEDDVRRWLADPAPNAAGGPPPTPRSGGSALDRTRPHF